MNASPASTPHKGGCLCGAVRFEISAEPKSGGFCQCRDCQRYVGNGHVAWMMCEESAVKIAGAVAYYDTKADSGATVSRGFCPKCGSRLATKSSELPGAIMISPGALDDPGAFKPKVVLFASRGHGWDQLDPALKRFDAMPPPRPPK